MKGIIGALILVFLPIFNLFSASKPCAAGMSDNLFPCRNITLQANIPLNRFRQNTRNASNIWGYVDPDDGREYAVIGLWNGTAVVDVTNPISPRIVGMITGRDSLWREVKVYSVFNSKTKKWDAYAYISTEATDGGLQVIDLSKLPARVSLAFTDREISTSHTLFIANIDYATGKKLPGLTPTLYVEGSNVAGLIAYSLQNPRNPKIVGRYSDTYVHDIYAETFTGQRARQCATGHDPCEIVFAWAGQDFRILDFTDKQNPVMLGSLIYPQLGYAHSGWISNDKRFLFNFDEFDEAQTHRNTRILTLNIADFRNPKVAATFRGKKKSIEHNGIVVGNKLYLSHYTRGLVVMDVTDPRKMRELSFFDTHPEDDENSEFRPSHPDHDGTISFNGAWGVYPFLPSGNILISDIERGLFILKEQ